ncbi:hypothetical protein NDU88_009029 [Pleurodeles waltl]|uniref:Uncharacterized protein n=1 Tax=Pleurodeles waltl TaxID=8319 RepID=A0AAV7RZC3_PLEWA|nr:hypothetical protein NDU88_009029 [Pleurodeles waltl]
MCGAPGAGACGRHARVLDLGADVPACWAYRKGAREDGEGRGAAVLQGAVLEELEGIWWDRASGRRCGRPAKA